MIPLIIAHEWLIRRGLRHFILEECKLTQCYEASAAEEALRLVVAHRPTLVILCLCHTEMDSVRLIRELRRKRKTLAILVCSRVPDPDHVLRCLDAGAHGFVSSEDDAEELKIACTAVQDGGFHLSRRASRGVKLHHPRKEAFVGKAKNLSEHLSDREKEVFDLLGQSIGCKDSSLRLGISPKTVESLYSRMKEKLEVKTTAELKRLAIAAAHEPKKKA